MLMILDMELRKTWLLLSALSLIFFMGGMGGQVGAGEPGLGKVKDPEIFERLTQGKEFVNVIVLLKGYKDYVGRVRTDEPALMDAVQSEISSQQDNVLNRLDPSLFKLRHRFKNILGFSGSINQDGLLALVAMLEVELVEKDELQHPNLAQGIPLMNALGVRSTHNGTGVSVAISDTGIDYTHPMLGGGGFPNAKVIGGYDFGDDDPDPMDCNNHGTPLAGIVAGTLASGPGDYIGGVAHNARLYALKVSIGCTGSAITSDIVASWDWAVTHKYDDPNNPILVLITSFGGGGYTSPCDADNPIFAAAADNLVANGITFFASSGNNGYADRIIAPACVSNAISVGAVYDADVGSKYFPICSDPTTQPDQVACYSNSAYFLDLLAPNFNAYTTAAGGGYLTTFGGTSAAAAYAAGAAAILQSYAKATTGSYYTPTQLKTQLVDNGDPITDPRNNITKPRVNVGNAIGAWNFCFKDVAFTPALWMSLEWDRLLRGQAILATSPSFPAPITGQFDPAAGEATFSVDYLNETGLRFYRIDVGTLTGETWGIRDADSSYYDNRHPATLVPCPPVSSESAEGETGAME